MILLSIFYQQSTNVVVVQQQPTSAVVMTHIVSDIPDYFVLSIVMTILCVFFNLCALVCTIPAIFLSIQVCHGCPSYRIGGNFGGCKLWRIRYKNTFGEINFGKFEHLYCYLVLNKVFWQKKLWQIYGRSQSVNVSTLQSFPPYGKPRLPT